MTVKKGDIVVDTQWEEFGHGLVTITSHKRLVVIFNCGAKKYHPKNHPSLKVVTTAEERMEKLRSAHERLGEIYNAR